MINYQCALKRVRPHGLDRGGITAAAVQRLVDVDQSSRLLVNRDRASTAVSGLSENTASMPVR
jgi:hypothetical protein